MCLSGYLQFPAGDACSWSEWVQSLSAVFLRCYLSKMGALLFLGLLKLFRRLIRFNNVVGRNHKISTSADWGCYKRFPFFSLTPHEHFTCFCSSLYTACKTSSQQYFTATALITYVPDVETNIYESHMTTKMTTFHFVCLNYRISFFCWHQTGWFHKNIVFHK